MTNHTEDSLSLRDLLRIIDRRRVVFLSTAIGIFTLSVLACIFLTRKYEAVGEFQVEESSTDALDLSSMMSSASSSGGLSSASIDTELQTQAQILQSESLALQVIKDLKLRDNPDFQPKTDPIHWAERIILPQGPPDRPGASLEDSPHLREQLYKEFDDHLKVSVDAGTRLIDVHYTNRDRKTAADVVNHLIQGLIDYTFQTKFKATRDISTWLEGQLTDLRKDSEDLQTKVVALQKGSGIFGVGGTDLQGKPVVYSPILDQLQASTTELSQAEMNKVLKGSVYEAVESGSPELISQLAGTMMVGGANTGVTNSLELIQNLRGQEATLQGQLDSDLTHFGPAYPKVIGERQSLASVQQSLKDEMGRLRARAKNDYEIAKSTADGAKRSFDEARVAAERLNDKTIEYSILQKEASDSQDLYQDLLKRLKEAGIVDGLKSSNISIVDTALQPDRPAIPNIPLYLFVGLAGGIFFGLGVALLVNAIDNKIQGVEEIEAMEVPLFGVLPQFKGGETRPGYLLTDGRESTFGEALRALRSLMLISRSGDPPKVILITSGSPGEGKSTVTLNLAASFAQYSKKVLLVEGDLRRPTLARRLGIKDHTGLSVLLSDQSARFEPVLFPQQPNLDLLFAGPTPPYPAEMLGSARMKQLMEEWHKDYDFVLIDSPPVLPVTDAQILAAYADAVVLIVRVGVTSRVAAKRATSLLIPHAKNPDSPNVGVVVNSISTRSAAYYGYYGYYGGQKYEYTSHSEKHND